MTEKTTDYLAKIEELITLSRQQGVDHKEVLATMRKKFNLKDETQQTLKNQKDREKRLIKEFETKIQDIHKDYTLEHRKFEKRINELIPNTINLRRNNLILIKTAGINGFGIGRKDELKFTHYVRGRQVIELPEEHKKTFKIIIVAYFDTYRKIINFGTLNRNHTEIKTYHTKGYSVCLGDDKRPFKDIKPDNIQSINESLNMVMETVQTLNPYSPLNGISDITRNLRPTIRYVQEQQQIGDREQAQARNRIHQRRQQTRIEQCCECGIEHTRAEMTGRENGRYFCSEDYIISYYETNGETCAQCGNDYIIEDSTARDTNTFCSVYCEDDYSYDHEELKCVRCGTIYEREESTADDNHFCSSQCQEEQEQTQEETEPEVNARNPMIANIMRQSREEHQTNRTRAWR